MRKGNLNPDNVGAKYDDKAHTDVVVCPAKDLSEENQTEESFGRACRLRSVI